MGRDRSIGLKKSEGRAKNKEEGRCLIYDGSRSWLVVYVVATSLVILPLPSTRLIVAFSQREARR